MNDPAAMSRSRRGNREPPGTNPCLEFPKAAFYRNIRLFQAGIVRESPAARDAPPFSERHLQCIWADSTWRPVDLKTSDGERIAVGHPGRWNLEAGPDFLDATLEVGPGHRHLRGDVEVHIRPSDWTRHGHDADPRYSRVVAHVCYYDGGLPVDALPPGAVSISLKDALRRNPGFSFDAIDVVAYPYAAIESDRPPCRVALDKLTPDQRESLLESAGQERIRVKALRMQAAIHESDEEQCLFEEIMAALGYKQNQRAFRLLARSLPLAALRREADGDPETAYVMLLGVGGLLPTGERGYDADTQRFLRRLWDRWWKKGSAWRNVTMPRDAWRLSALRPQNRPVRRLAAAAALFSPPGALSDRLKQPNPARPAAWFTETARTIEASARMDYWTHRLTFAGGTVPAATALIGRQRSAAILSNAVLPFLAATGTNVVPLLDHLPPEQDNALIRRTAHALFGRDHNPALYRRGIRQQGLLQIFHDFCVNTRNGCPDCKLAAALRSY